MTVLGDSELILAQALDGLAVFAGDLHIDLDELDGGANGAFGVSGGLRRRGRRSGLARILREGAGNRRQGQDKSQTNTKVKCLEESEVRIRS